MTFLIPNLPYLIASPSAWFKGVFVPFIKNLVPIGPGIDFADVVRPLGGGSLAHLHGRSAY